MVQSIYQELRTIVTKIPVADKIVLTGDFNARAVQVYNTWDSLIKYDIGNMNSNGPSLLELFTQFDLVMCKSFFNLKVIHKVICIHPRYKHGHILDDVITRKRVNHDICSMKAMRGVDSGACA